jgi:hypothetical protein
MNQVRTRSNPYPELADELDVLLNKGGAKTRNSIILPEHSIGRLLSHNAGNVRSAAFSVLVTSVSSARPFTLRTLKLLQQNLGLLHSDTDAKVRNEVLSNTKQMVRRIKGAVSFLTRDIATSHIRNNQISQKKGEFPDLTNVASQATMALKEHEDFISWYQNFLGNELVPTASYQRHITALRAIQIFVNCGILIRHEKMSREYSADTQSQENLPENIFTEKLMRLLLDLLMDPFEDVRAVATQLLKLAPEKCFMLQHIVESSDRPKSNAFPLLIQNRSNHSNGKILDRTYTSTSGRKRLQQAKVPGILVSFIQKAETASRRTGRADLADGVARTYELIYFLQSTDEARLDLLENLVSELEGKVVIAENDLAQAVLLSPVHEDFAAIR